MRLMTWMAVVGVLLPRLGWGAECHVASVLAPDRLDGRQGEIIALADRSVWEVTAGPGYMDRPRGEVIVCPSSNEMGVGAEVLRIRTVERSASARIENAIRIESVIKGRFNGWSGKTEFALANGQVWRQVRGGHSSGSKDDPRVCLTRKADGVYEMQVEGFVSRIGVIRIR
ncbi:hypothetical protein [Stenotrophomonas sp.]|uniref:hypothetical protein n=1 Tax=Stenotrophomonas sp. TaxID=69392 RepID=UPI0028A66A97|nr:hypothetical protein [Stenotrophomonas sp.]